MPETVSSQGVLSAAADYARMSVSGMGGVAFQISGTFSGTITFEGSIDGQNFRALLVTPSNSTSQVTTATAAGLWSASTVGYLAVQARMSAYTSGAATVKMRSAMASPSSSSSGGGGGGGTSSTFGDPFPATGTAAGFIDASGNMGGGVLDASGFLKVNVAAGGAGGGAVTVADGADVTQGAIADTKITGDNSGTVNAHLRGLTTILGDVWDSVNHWLKVSLAASSAVIGHVITDSGSTTAVTGNVTVVQGTGTNLHTVVDSGSITANAGTNLNTSALALEAGHLATIDTSTAATAAVAGTTAGAKVITDANGTLQQYLRGLVTLAVTAGSFLVTATLTAGTALIGRVSGSDETSTIYNGTTALTPKFAVIATSSSGVSTLVAAVTSKQIRVTDIVLMANAAVNVKFQSHVSPTDVTGLLYLAANTGFAPGYDPTGHFQTVAGEALDINLSGAVAVGGWLKYLEV